MGTIHALHLSAWDQSHPINTFEWLFRALFAAKSFLKRTVQFLRFFLHAWRFFSLLNRQGLPHNHLSYLSLDQFWSLLILPPMLPVQQSYIGLLFFIWPWVYLCECNLLVVLSCCFIILLRSKQRSKGALLQLLLLPFLIFPFSLEFVLAAPFEILLGLYDHWRTVESK
jgi:hypothetical protein